MNERYDLSQLASRYGVYPIEAYVFVGEGLHHATRSLGKQGAEGVDRHISAHELVEGVLELASTRFGCLASSVLRSWSLRCSEDIGAVTFHLIEEGLFGKQPGDCLEDFQNGPIFHELIQRKTRERMLTEV